MFVATAMAAVAIDGEFVACWDHWYSSCTALFYGGFGDHYRGKIYSISRGNTRWYRSKPYATPLERNFSNSIVRASSHKRLFSETERAVGLNLGPNFVHIG